MRTTIASAMLFAFLVGCGLEGPVPQKKEQAASNTPTPGAPAQESKQPDKLTGPKNRPADSGSPGSQEPKQVDKFAGTANNADNPARQQATSSWSPDPALLAKLAPAKLDLVAGFYRIRQPTNCYLAVSPGTVLADGNKEYRAVWFLPKPDKKPQSTLQMWIVEPNPRVGIDHYPFGAMFDVAIASGSTNVRKEPSEKGTVNGIEFTRHRWSAEELGKKVRGLFYIAKIDQRAVFFLIKAPAEGDDTAIRIAESAVLTLEKPAESDVATVPEGARAPSEPSPSKPPLGWSPDPELVAKLDLPGPDPVSDQYRLQPPSGWVYAENNIINEQPQVRTASGVWHEIGRSDTPHCTLTLEITEFKDKPNMDGWRSEATFDMIMKADTITAKAQRAQKGRLGGIDFNRYRWTGMAEGKKVRGVMYLGTDDNRLLSILIEAPADGHDAALRLAESAILTLRKP